MSSTLTSAESLVNMYEGQWLRYKRTWEAPESLARKPAESTHNKSHSVNQIIYGSGPCRETALQSYKDKGGPPSSTFDRDRAPLIPVLSRRAQHRGRKRGPLHALVFASTLHERICRAQDSSSRVFLALRVDITLSPTFARGVAAARQRRRQLLP